MTTSSSSETSVPAGKLAPWGVDNLPEPPRRSGAPLLALLGPGVVLAGTSIGTGEWLFGPAVSAQYGASLYWLAMLSILLQLFCNVLFIRYALFCGEPINVGILRLSPGPKLWLVFFAILDISFIFPYSASNAAIPLSAAILGRLPNAGDASLVRGLGIGIFLLAFVPLIFGGTVYRMLEKLMAVKLTLVLGFLTFVAVTMVSAPVVWDVLSGFVRVGTVPLRPDTLIVDRHFSVAETVGDTRYVVRGTWERKEGLVTGEIIATQAGQTRKFDLAKQDLADPQVQEIRERVLQRTRPLAGAQRFEFEVNDEGARLMAEGVMVDNHKMKPTRLQVIDANGTREFASLDQVPEPFRARLENHLKHEGLAYVNGFSYVADKGKLPPLDWAFVVAFIGIAGAGGLTNLMFSNYARDKGWGMGHHVGAIPSAFGGIKVELSHSGKVFPLDDTNRSRWRGWLKHARRDQTIWLVASVVGMALPCMMSLEFIRNASVVGDRVAAMTAEGIAGRYPDFASLFWFLTLFCGFIVLAPGQVSMGDQFARRWTDMLWNGSRRVRRWGDVRYLYYGILGAHCAAGLVILLLFPAVQIAKVSVILQNIALGSISLLSLYVARTFMPKELRPSGFHQVGVVLCGLFFLSISLALFFL